MTVNSETRKAGPYVGNGTTTAFAFSFLVFSEADLLVVRRSTTTGVETTLTRGTDYSVAINASQDVSPGGTVTLAAALGSTSTLVITSDVLPLQQTDLTNQGGFYPSVITAALDKLTVLVQQLYERTSRSLRLSLSTPAGVDATLPPPTAGAVIAWNADATGLSNVAPGEIAAQQVYGVWRYAFFDGDGATVNFDLPSDPSSVANLDVSIDGVVKVPIADFVLYGTRLSFTAAPALGASIYVRYGSAAAETVRYETTQRFVATAGQTAFTVTAAYEPGAGAMVVYRNGLRLEPGIDYVETDATTITMQTGMTLGDAITCAMYPVVTTTSAASAGAGASLVATQLGTELRFKGIVAGDNVTVTETASDITISAAAGGSGEVNTASSVGAGSSIVKDKVGVDLRFKSVKAGANITVTANADDLTIAATASGETNTASNLGAGSGLYASKSGVDLRFKSLVAGANVTLTPDANTITIAASGSGGVADTYLNVQDYGATGDGSTDDTTAVQAAIDASIAQSRDLYFPRGTYIVGPLTYVTNSYGNQPNWFGDGSKLSILKKKSGTTGELVTVGASASTFFVANLHFRGLQFHGTSKTSTAAALKLYDVVRSKFSDCVFTTAGYGVSCLGGVETEFENCIFEQSNIGIRIGSFTSSAGGGWPNLITLTGCAAIDNTEWGVWFDNGRILNVQQCNIEGNGTTGNTTTGGVRVGPSIGQESSLAASFGISIENSWFEANKGAASLVFLSGRNRVQSCYFVANSNATYDVYAGGGQYAVYDTVHDLVKTNHIYEEAAVGSPNYITNVGNATYSIDSSKTKVNFSGGAGGGDVTLAGTQTFTGVNTFSALSKWGAATSDTMPWGASGGGAGAIFQEIGIGTSGAPSTNNKPGLYIEKWCSNNAGATIGDVGAAHFKARKKSGASNLFATTITAIRDGGSGDVGALHSRAITTVPLSGSPGGALYGGWFVAQNSGGAGTGHMTGIEIDVIETAADGGHQTALTGNMSTGLWLALHESAYNCTAAIMTAPVGATASKWHTGLLIGQDTIVPKDASNRNEAILVQGGSTDAYKYTALRATGYLNRGIDLSGVPNQIHAFLAANESFVSFMNGSGVAMKALTIGNDSITRLYTGGLSTAHGLSIGRNSDDNHRAFFDNSDINPVWLCVDGALKQVTQGAANSGGTGYAVLRVTN